MPGAPLSGGAAPGVPTEPAGPEGTVGSAVATLTTTWDRGTDEA